jgi:CTP:molybdopterin cytidylyltransferase MocA
VTTLGIVLAAGGGSRFGGGKLLADFRGRPLVAWSIAAAVGAGLDEVVVVTGAEDLAAVVPDEVVEVPNPRWAEGQAGSIQVGIAHAERAGHDAVVVGLGDSPMVGTDAWRAVAAVDAPLAVASFDGRWCPPVRLAREIWPLLPTEGDEGARRLLADRADLVVAVPCAGDPADVDTQGDLDRWS